MRDMMRRGGEGVMCVKMMNNNRDEEDDGDM